MKERLRSDDSIDRLCRASAQRMRHSDEPIRVDPLFSSLIRMGPFQFEYSTSLLTSLLLLPLLPLDASK